METSKSRDTTSNRRAARRRGVRQPATLTLLPSNASRSVTLWDLGLDGLSVLSPRPVPPGSRCELQFDLAVDGQSTPIHATGKTVYSSYVGAEGFRVGLVFTQLADDTAALIQRFIGDTP
jgi:hypothetical protein